jgi:hypothetical protein
MMNETILSLVTSITFLHLSASYQSIEFSSSITSRDKVSLPSADEKNSQLFSPRSRIFRIFGMFLENARMREFAGRQN